MTMRTALPATVELKENITDKERQIFEFLLQVIRHFSLQTQIRVAGGWVRDKLLGQECNDIDIALDDMLGTEFTEKVNEYLLSLGKEKLKIKPIPRNPEQSKHLETAKMLIDGIEFDFVNLRSEDYSENSRIPVMRFGTAKEDAYRRDLTINSLFYNLNTSSVEDFTGRGIEDLRSGRIRTPLPPKKTFLDDPLRVLRAIRFGARFKFILDEGLKIAASDHDVKAALAHKITRERIGDEINLMISGKQPDKAMTYIWDLQLSSVILSIPPEVEIPASEERLCVGFMSDALRIMQIIGGDEERRPVYMSDALRIMQKFRDEERRLSLYAALLLPFRKTVCRDIDKKDKPIACVIHIFRNSLKLNISDAEAVVSLHNAAEKFMSLIPLVKASKDIRIAEVDSNIEFIDVPNDLKLLRMLAGLLLREIKGFWRAALLLSMLLYPMDVDTCNTSIDSQIEHLELDRRRAELFKMIENKIIELGLEKIWETKPLLNGKEIINILELKTEGPLVGKLKKKLVEWQLRHPYGNREECIEWLRQTYFSNCLENSDDILTTKLTDRGNKKRRGFR
ncbi:hypothetical protein LguiA_034420 [Lonicera macranthoides]